VSRYDPQCQERLGVVAVFPAISRAMASQVSLDLKTTNLGVRSSNLFGRANNLLILIQNLCAIFCLLTADIETRPSERRGEEEDYSDRHS